MSRAPAPRPDPGWPGEFLSDGVAAKAGLNKSISDAGWGVFLTIVLEPPMFYGPGSSVATPTRQSEKPQL